MNNQHFLLVTLPYQSHINPTLRLAVKLTRAGARVTFATTVNGLNNIKTRPSLDGLSFDSFSDGHDVDGAAEKPSYYEDVRRVGSKALKNIMLRQGQKVDCVMYGLCLPWVATVARDLHVPSALFFIQPAAAFSVVYHLCKSDGAVVTTDIDLRGTLNLPGLPSLKYSEIPSSLLPTDSYYLKLGTLFHEHIKILQEHPNPLVLINTFDALEEEAIKGISDRVNMFPVGPLVPGKTERSLVCDVFQDSDRDAYLRWLDSKPEKSVVYVSFGSLVELKKEQKEEMFEGLIQSGHPFLWVVRNHGEEDEEMKGLAAVGGGLIVRWCSQVEVLNHVAVGCFVTHCGWNSTLESMVGGVALVGLPQFGDQMLNLKMTEDVWGTGVKTVADGGGVVGREEIKRCLSVVMGGGERAEEIKRNCEKWKRAAMEANEEGGSSSRNLNKFVESLKG